ncbi:hypothetical protein [Streptomyces sp. NPDC005573]|uniref:hypothetical protein n=1 Tax=Streptomyces sp. NPDC005573 TaxID=3156890 RepID=UPI0033AB79C7
MSNPPYQQPTGPQPHWGAPPPAPAPKKNSAGKAIGCGCVGIIGLFIICLAIGAAVDENPKSTTTSSSAAPRKAPPAHAPAAQAPTPADTTMDKHALTRLSVGVVWDSYTSEQRDSLCLGVDVYGTDWFARQMHSDNLDPDYAAQLVKAKCAAR